MSKQSQEEDGPVPEAERKEEETTEKDQIPIQAIVNEANNEKEASQKQRLSAPVPVVQKPLHFYKGDEKYPWKLEQLDSAVCLDQLEFKQIEEKDLPYGENIEIKVKETKVEGSGISKHVHYIVVGHDSKGEFECKRRYSEYVQFRKRLSELWIGIFIPILPSGSIGNPEQQVGMRIKYVNNFWRLLSVKSVLFESEQVQIFLRNKDVNIDTFLQGLKGSKIPELLQKYKNAFPEAFETSSKEQFLYRCKQIPEKLQKYQQYFVKKKITLSEYQDSFYRLGDVKTKYFKAVAKLEKELMPQYEDVLFKWFTGASLKDNQPGIMEKIQTRQEQSRKEKQKEKELETKPQEEEIKPEIKVQSKQIGLFSSQAFQSRLQDISSQIVNFNTSTSLIYDVLKFQLKEIDMVTTTIEQVRTIQKESAYLNRSIAINKEQVQALNTNKTTLKTFLMGGSQDDKKTRLTKESADFEQKLLKVTALYNVVLVLVQEQMESYHKERADHYYRNITKALTEDLKLARCITEFHVYENQLFGKERVRRIKELVGSQEGLEEIVSDST